MPRDRRGSPRRAFALRWCASVTGLLPVRCAGKLLAGGDARVSDNLFRWGANPSSPTDLFTPASSCCHNCARPPAIERPAPAPAACPRRFGDKDGRGQEVLLQHPLGVAVSADGGPVFVADSYNHKLKALNVETGEARARPRRVGRQPPCCAPCSVIVSSCAAPPLSPWVPGGDGGGVGEGGVQRREGRRGCALRARGARGCAGRCAHGRRGRACFRVCVSPWCGARSARIKSLSIHGTEPPRGRVHR